MRGLLNALIITTTLWLSELAYAQATPTPANAPTPAPEQLAKMEAALQPMVAAIAELKNYQVEIKTQMEMEAQGQKLKFTSNLKLWNSAPDKFYFLNIVGTPPQPVLNTSVFGDGIKATNYLAGTNLYFEVTDGYPTMKLKTMTEASVFVALLYDAGLRGNIMKLQTPDQALVAIADEVFDGVPCKKITLGVAPEDLTYYYPAAPPHLPVALINNSAALMKMKTSSWLKWTPNSQHPESIFTPALPPTAKKAASLKEYATALQKASLTAIQGQATTATAVMTQPAR